MKKILISIAIAIFICSPVITVQAVTTKATKNTIITIKSKYITNDYYINCSKWKKRIIVQYNNI